MIKLISLAVKRPVLTFVVFAALLIAGVSSLLLLPIDFLPDITFPVVSVITVYPAAGSFDIERLVTQKMEEGLSALPNVKEVTSFSQENVSVVTITFNWGTNIDAAAADVRDAIDRVLPYLPDETERPILFKFDVTQMPVLILGATTDRSDIDLYEIVDKDVTSELAKIDGVGSVTIFAGETKRQINVIVDKNKLDGYGLSLENIINAIRAENISLPAGEVNVGRKSYLVRVPAEVKGIDELKTIVVGVKNNRFIRLSDIATLEDGYAERMNFASINGKPGILFGVYKRSGANTVKVASLIARKLDELSKIYKGVNFNIIVDTSDFIKRSISNLARTVLYAALLVMLVTLLFVGRLDSGAIISVTIPVSLVVVFLFLYIKGSTINIISLSAIAIAIGMVVDNAIVVTENILYHREKGESKTQASIFGAQEVSEAILASTLTTVVIFLPLLIIKGLVGVLFRELAWAIPISIAISLFCALTLSPMMASKLISYDPTKRNKSFFQSISLAIYNPIERVYLAVLRWALGHKKIVLLAAFVLFVGAVFVFTRLKSEFLPESDESRVIGFVEMPLGTSLEESWKFIEGLQKEVAELVPEAKYIGARVGRTRLGFGALVGMAESPSKGYIILRLANKEERKRSSFQIARDLSARFKGIPGVKKIYFSTMQQGGGSSSVMGFGKAISVEVYGDDIGLTDSIAGEIGKILSGLKGSSGVTISREPGSEEIRLILDRDKMRSLGLVPASVASYVRYALYGVSATTIRREASDLSIFVELDSLSRQNIATLENLQIPTPAGKYIPLSNIAEIQIARSPLTIERKNKMRYVRVECDLAGVSLGEFTRKLKDRLTTIKLPRGVTIKVAGQAKEQTESFSTLFLAFVVGVLLVYLVMSAQFESFLDPFIIVFSVPFVVVGIVFIYLLTGITFSLMSYVGMVMLVGIVVNNAIVLVDYMNILRWRGYPLSEVLITAGRRRLRPILMTTLTTIFGLIPLVLSKAEGSEMWQPLGLSVIGGLLVSTIASLVIVPVIYSIIGKYLKREIK